MRRHWIWEWMVSLLIMTVLLVSTNTTRAADSVPPDQDSLHDHQDALTVPPGVLGAMPAADDPDYYYPSAYMAGSVAVQILLPESSLVSSAAEDWQPEQISAIKQSVDKALDWWKARTPGARLRFESEIRLVPVAVEPISYGLADEGVWIGDALRQLGFNQQGYFAQAFAATDALRDARDTDWALTIFVVNSANDPDGRFSDKRFAYAYIGGPFMVVTSDSGPYNTSNLASVTAHEIGHLFGALDQYPAAQVPCEQRAGYLNVPTLNSRYGNCASKLPSIMYEPLSAFAAGEVDPYALGQIGYRDSDADGLIDVLDTTPTLSLQAVVAAASGQPLLQGNAIDAAFPGAYGTLLSINAIDYLQYRVGGGDWQLATPEVLSADGNFQLTLPLYDGQYSVGLRAVNSAGVASAVVTRSLSVQGVGPAPDYDAQVPAFASNRIINVALSGPAQSVQLSTEPSFAGATWQPLTPQASLDLGSDAEASYSVYVRFRSASGALSPISVLTTTIDHTPPSGRVRKLANGALVVDATDDGSGVAEMQLNTNPQIAADGWRPYQPSVELPEGALLLGVRFRDHAGNVSPLYTPSNIAAVVALPIIIR